MLVQRKLKFNHLNKIVELGGAALGTIERRQDGEVISSFTSLGLNEQAVTRRVQGAPQDFFLKDAVT